MNILKLIKNPSVLAISILLAATSSTFASSESCGVGFVPLVPTCRTKSVPADLTNHFVYVSVTPFMKYRVVDSTNGAVVARGTAGYLGFRKTIPGLYARYYGAIDGWESAAIGVVIGGRITINND